MSADIIEGEARPLAIREEIENTPALFAPMAPAAKLAFAREVATSLREMLLQGKIVINKQGKEERKPLIIRIPQKGRDGEIIGYSEHVELEGWQTCGMLAGGITAVVRWTKDLPNGEGCDAFAEAVWQGQVIGSGEGHCDRNESAKRKREPYYSIKSMAQVRAQSRAYRSVLSWIIVLAGFSPTPASEVPRGGFDNSDTPPQQKPANDNDAKRKHDRIKLAEVCTQRNITDEQYREAMMFLFGDECFDASGKPSSTMLDPKQRGKLYRYLLEMEVS